MDANPTHDRDPEVPKADERTKARRALLKAALYTVPAVLGTFVVARRADAQASCLPVCSCRPNCCQPDINCLPWFCRPIASCRPFSGS